MLNPRQIEAFRAVMLTGGITAAAELLNISQPAVSRLISDLQYALKLTLFERRGSRIAPTSEALSLYQEVERSFVGLERIEQAARDLQERRAGILRIGAMPALAIGFLPRFVAQFLEQRPRVDVSLWGSSSTVVLDWVAAGQCELGFGQSPVEHGTVLSEKLPPVPVVAIVPSGHPLAARSRLTPQDFAGEAFISLGPSTLLRYRIDAAFADHGVNRTMRVETQLTMIACAMVASGAGVSIVDPFTAEEYAGRGVAIRPFEPRVHIEMAVLQSAQRSLSTLAQDFLGEFRSAVAAFGRREG
ncbi:LysR substrate-binding domain-containing protein [Azospirillum canadense]|uniref:LysR substrate-binding domain-containing protein n=1 Tax=Azospirillum canadense TaxID=403962 RepID=UPI002225EB3B|nr:LysR substrate-binding domain-containing protein [Azospirillum canadense]MCW2240049.1 DNA-binding transcriptional LysR family regulator [Azospirillum canadense]